MVKILLVGFHNLSVSSCFCLILSLGSLFFRIPHFPFYIYRRIVRFLKGECPHEPKYVQRLRLDRVSPSTNFVSPDFL